MGNREDLLAGARQCLLEKGWARTTVRDIAVASGGVSHAAIGYHFGSRDALLTEAFTQAMDEWGAEIGKATAIETDTAAPPVEQFEAMWSQMVKTFGTHRQLWVASLEAFLQAEHSPELRELMAASQREGRTGSAAALAGVDEDVVPDATVRTLGSVQLALISGVMLQWLVDPEHAPTGPEVVAGLRALVARIEASHSA